MEVASVSLKGCDSPCSARTVELASQLRSAVMDGDDGRIGALLSELLRVTGLTKGQRIRLQLRALSNLVHTLRSLTLNDEVTGLCNRRGFLQTGTRLLDLAMRDGQRIHLIYFSLGQLEEIRSALGRSAGDALVRQMANFMRDLYPSYGVYEVLGRLSATEFAALTPDDGCASAQTVLRRARTPLAGRAAPALPVRVGVAHFNPFHPLAIDELLQSAAHALQVGERNGRTASVGHAPQPDMTLC
ncbi:MAG TPA: GGDEF domain-containing protein [Steroidobacteraceae bacterium]|nr:GGDEF domain-containing protein [Steroidobacteraceae bacterium]